MLRAFRSIRGWQRQTFIDYPGKIATALFFAGCNLRCPYCHNPDLVLGGADAVVDGAEFFAYLDKRKKMIEGVVISGGEPAVQPQELAALVTAIRARGFAIKLDTNGMLPEVIAQCAPDYLALDLKTVPSAYRILLKASFTDVEQRLIKSLAIVRSMGADAEVRITCAPEIISEEIIAGLRPLLRGVARVFLQPFQNNVPLLDPAFNAKKPLPKESLRRFCDILKDSVGQCRIRGE
ncbi:MAG: anaerobic ribonucleoside-triphosphate reductase activating protein [Chitinivibrionales bacterium]|nr:anaerobic ribonucleoside-triphosphate reductase activating protein [Chitinivibrionales bacterium]